MSKASWGRWIGRRRWWLVRERVSRGTGEYVLIYQESRPKLTLFDPETQNWSDGQARGRAVVNTEARCWRFPGWLWHRLTTLRLKPGTGPIRVAVRLSVELDEGRALRARRRAR